MKVLFLLFSFSCFGMGAFAQVSTQPDTEENVGKAKEIIDRTCSEYDSYKTIQVDFVLMVKHPNYESKDVIKGYAEGDKYRLSSKEQNIICNGKSVWFHLKENNKVMQTLPNPKEVNIIFPAQMLRIYERNYFYSLGGEFEMNGVTLQKLEFLPKSSLEKFSKINVYVDKKTSQIVRISRFGKEGALYILDLKNVLYNIKLDPALFKLEMS